MFRECINCGKTNRIPAEHLTDAGRCGECKAPLDPVDEPLEVDSAEFKDIIKAVKVPVLVDFWAEWCMPCQMAAPQVHQAAKNLAGRALVLKVNTDRHPDLAELFQVRGIPNFAVIKDGKLVQQHPGLVDHRQLERWVEETTA